jgi:hypothetical protein
VSLHHVAKADVYAIASDAVALYREYLDRHSYAEDEAAAAAIRDVVEGSAVNHDALNAEARAIGRRPPPGERRRETK